VNLDLELEMTIVLVRSSALRRDDEVFYVSLDLGYQLVMDKSPRRDITDAGNTGRQTQLARVAVRTLVSVKLSR